LRGARPVDSGGRRGIRRVYGPGVLEQLALMALGRAAGFSLDEIQAMLTSGGSQAIDREALSRKADEVDAMARRLLKAVASGVLESQQALREAGRAPKR
jgi:DNA-binding transcriptional MerR regulator